MANEEKVQVLINEGVRKRYIEAQGHDQKWQYPKRENAQNRISPKKQALEALQKQMSMNWHQMRKPQADGE